MVWVPRTLTPVAKPGCATVVMRRATKGLRAASSCWPRLLKVILTVVRPPAVTALAPMVPMETSLPLCLSTRVPLARPVSV